GRRRRTAGGSGRASSTRRAATTPRTPASARAPRAQAPAPPRAATHPPGSAASRTAAARAPAAAAAAPRAARADTASRERIFVHAQERGCRRLVRRDLPARRRAQPLAQLAVCEQALDRSTERRDVARGDEQAVDAVLDRVDKPTDRARDDRARVRHRL